MKPKIMQREVNAASSMLIGEDGWPKKIWARKKWAKKDDMGQTLIAVILLSGGIVQK